MKRALLATCLATSIAGSAARAQSLAWARSYGTKAIEVAYRLVPIGDEETALLALRGGSSEGAVVMRLSRGGEIQWQRSVAIPTSQVHIWDFVATSDGDMALLGSTNAPGPPGGDLLLVRFDTDGNVVRQNVYDAGGQEQPAAMALGPDGDVYVAGMNPYPLILRIDAAGSVRFARNYGGFGMGLFGPPGIKALAPAPDGGLFVLGVADFYDPPGLYLNGWVLRLDAAGDVVWANRYPVPTVEYLWGIVATLDGGCAVLQSAQSPDTSEVRHLAADGEMEWRVAFDASRFVGTALAATHDGEILVAGQQRFPDANAALVGLKADGQPIATRMFGVRAGMETFAAIQPLPGGGAVLGGRTDFLTPGGNGADAWLLRLEDDGSTLSSCNIEASLDAPSQFLPILEREPLTVTVANASVTVAPGDAVIRPDDSISAECARIDFDEDGDGAGPGTSVGRRFSAAARSAPPPTPASARRLQPRGTSTIE